MHINVKGKHVVQCIETSSLLSFLMMDAKFYYGTGKGSNAVVPTDSYESDMLYDAV